MHFAFPMCRLKRVKKRETNRQYLSRTEKRSHKMQRQHLHTETQTKLEHRSPELEHNFALTIVFPSAQQFFQQLLKRMLWVFTRARRDHQISKKVKRIPNSKTAATRVIIHDHLDSTTSKNLELDSHDASVKANDEAGRVTPANAAKDALSFFFR